MSFWSACQHYSWLVEKRLQLLLFSPLLVEKTADSGRMGHVYQRTMGLVKELWSRLVLETTVQLRKDPSSASFQHHVFPQGKRTSSTKTQVPRGAEKLFASTTTARGQRAMQQPVPRPVLWPWRPVAVMPTRLAIVRRPKLWPSHVQQQKITGVKHWLTPQIYWLHPLWIDWSFVLSFKKNVCTKHN